MASEPPIFLIAEDLTPPMSIKALRQFSIAVLNDQGLQTSLPHWVEGLTMETSAHSDLDANLKEGFSQVRVTMPKASLVDQAVGPKAPEDPLALRAGRSAPLPAAVALLAQIAMGAAVRSEAAVAGVAREASPAAIRPEVSPVVIPLEVLQGAAMGVAEAVDRAWLIKSTQKRIIRSSFFILSLTGIAEPCKFI